MSRIAMVTDGDLGHVVVIADPASDRREYFKINLTANIVPVVGRD